MRVKKFSLSKYIAWAKKHYASQKDVLDYITKQIQEGSHYSCKLDSRTIASIKKEGWAIMDDWIIEV